MNDNLNNTEPHQTIEERLHLVLDDAKKGFCEGHENFEKQVQKSPTKAVLGAVAAGYVLHHLPVRALLVTQVRVLAALITPALFIYKAASLYDFVQKNRSRIGKNSNPGMQVDSERADH